MINLKNKSLKRKFIVAILITAVVLCQAPYAAFGAGGTKVSEQELMTVIDETVNYIHKNSKDEALSLWQVIALAGAEQDVPDSYYEGIEKYVRDEKGSFRKVTDYAKIAIAVTALNRDPENVAGYNIIEKIYNNERMTLQGTNGPAFALIALDAKDYELPEGALWDRGKLIEWILNRQNADGGFPLACGDESDVDITAMVIQSLSKYRYNLRAAVAIGKALAFLSDNLFPEGEYETWGNNGSESISQMIIALAGLNISLDNSVSTEEGNLLSKLLSFRGPKGGFSHIKGEGADTMATEQALLALVAYSRFLDGRSWIYTMEEKPLSIPEKDNDQKEAPDEIFQ